MVETSLEILCNSCREKFWYDGDKEYPLAIQCPNCYEDNFIPEDG